MLISKYYKWIVVSLLWGVALLNYLDRQMLSTMRPAMQSDIVELQSAANFGYLMGIFLWVYGFMSPVSGVIADKFNRKWLIVASLFIWSAVTYCMGGSTNFQQIYWLRALMGVSESIYLPASLALIADFHQGKTRSLAIGVHMTGIYCGQAMGGFGATIAAAYSWQTTFYTFGLVGIVYSFVLIAFLQEKRPGTDITLPDSSIVKQRLPAFRVLSLLLSNISFWIILFYFAAPSLPGWAIKNWLPTLFAEKLDIPMSRAGPLSTIAIAVSSFLGVIFGGILSDRWAQRNLLGRIYTSAIGLMLTLPALVLLGLGQSLVHIFSAALCFGVGWGMYDANNMPILCQFVSAKQRATAYGIMNLTGVFAGAFITDWLGRSTDAGNLARDFAMLAGIVIIAIALQLFFLRPRVIDFKG